MRAGEHSAAAAIAVAVALAASPAAADWLVLSDGGQVETAGPWEVRGDLVVFTLTNGTLSSVRASRVDLPASEAATEARRRPAEAERLPAMSPPASPPPEVPEVPTEQDPPPEAGPAAVVEGEETASEGAPPPVAAGAQSGGDPRLTVTAWSTATPGDYDGTVLTGRLRNVGDQLLVQAAVDALVYDASGALLARTPASVPAGPIAPDRLVAFEARFPGVYGVATARFDVRGVGFLESEPSPRNP